MDVIRTYYAEGQLKKEYCLINNKKEGLYKRYYENRQIDCICNYINEKNEEYIRYYSNGQLWVICNYINKKNREHKKYLEDGKLVSHKIDDNNISIQTIL